MKNGSSRARKSPDPKRYITPAAFARMVSVSRQYLSQCFREEKLVKTENGFVDLLDERTILFMAERENRKPTANQRKAPSVPKGYKTVDDEEGPEDTDDMDDDESDPDMRDDLLSLQKRKLKAEIVKKELEIATIEGAVIDERIIASLIEAFGQGIRLNFVDVCLRQSEQICAMLGCPGKEREVQEYLEVDNGRRLEEVKRNVEKIKNTMKRTRIERGLDKEEGRG